MESLVFATANSHKLTEVRDKLGKRYIFRSLADIGCEEEIPETANTLEGNALQKARFVSDNYGENCFAEDSGLEIDALDGRPGVITAHYAGADRDPLANMKKVLEELGDTDHREAQFRAVIALSIDGEEHLFEGIVRGTIARKLKGEGGFGYDPIFIPEGYDKTFAELPSSVKKEISHRSRAVAKLVDFLDPPKKRG